MKTPLGIAHLTLLPLTPPELVDVAAAAGFDFIGVRVRAVTAHERSFPMHARSQMLRDTRSRLDATGVYVRDIEFLPITASTDRADWLPALESGAALGATAMTVAGADPDRARLIDTLERLRLDAAEHGIRPLVEPISYQPLSSVADAARVARATGAGLMLDPLHICRGGSSIAEVESLEADLVPVLQLCDAPSLPPGEASDVRALQDEARAGRCVVGTGELPLADLLRAVAPGTPVSIEVPDPRRLESLGALEFAAVNARAARELVAHVNETRTVC